MNRQICKYVIDSLKTSKLWINCLEKDCKLGEVFLTVRNNIRFFHKGGKLFEFDKNGFMTHTKFASVINSSSDYLTETEFSKSRLVSSFEKGYERIKENCSKFSGDESIGVSNLYSKYSYLSDENIVVLDIEISLRSMNENRSQDRIDLLLFNKDTRILTFVEAKHFSNSEIWADSRTPDVIGQIKRYEKQIADNRADIISEYANCVKTLNLIFNCSLPVPAEIDDKVTLLIFGFDNDQKIGKLTGSILENPCYRGINLYKIGNAENINSNTLSALLKKNKR